MRVVNQHGDWSVMFVDIIFRQKAPTVTSKKEIIICVLPAAGSVMDMWAVLVLQIIVTKLRIMNPAARVIGQRIGGQIINVQTAGSKEDG